MKLELMSWRSSHATKFKGFLPYFAITLAIFAFLAMGYMTISAQVDMNKEISEAQKYSADKIEESISLLRSNSQDINDNGVGRQSSTSDKPVPTPPSIE